MDRPSNAAFLVSVLILFSLLQLTCSAVTSGSNATLPPARNSPNIQSAQDVLFATQVEGGKYGYIDATAKIVIPPQFDVAFSFHEGLALIKNDNKYGFIDKTGKLVVPAKFSALL